MAAPWITAEIADVVFHRRVPAITYWNRLEGRPRADDFTRALKVEVRDALWMLTRQWQLGEFAGDDAGSPVFAKVLLSTTRLEKYRADAHAVGPFDDDTPLEARVEARPVPLELGTRDVALDLRLLAGRQWLKLMASIGDFAAEFRNEYPIHAPDPSDPADAVYTAHPEAWSAFRLAGRRMDGVKLYRHLIDGGHAWDDIPALDPHRGEVDDLAERFVRWFERLIHQPGEEDAWLPDRLEYQFACAAPDRGGEKVLVAEEYALGHLDWYAVDADAGAGAARRHARRPARRARRSRSSCPPRSASRACRTRAGGRSRTAARTSATCGRTRPTSASCCCSSSRSCTPTTGT